MREFVGAQLLKQDVLRRMAVTTHLPAKHAMREMNAAFRDSYRIDTVSTELGYKIGYRACDRLEVFAPPLRH